MSKSRAKNNKWIFVFVFLLSVGFSVDSFLHAQMAERVYGTDHRVAPEMKKQLTVEVDNLSFFKNNEYAGSFQKGYTLPGFRLAAKAVYFPWEGVKLEAGIYGLHFWGADRYPNMAYRDIAQWKGEQYQKGFHLLPWCRAQIALSERVNLVLGNIYGSTNHHLIEPLYHPEMRLTSDPEAGMQVLYHSPFLDLDGWINWESFIFRGDTHPEVFIFGLSSRMKFNDTSSSLHLYMPIQGVIQHRGGEIDTIFDDSVQTLMNGSAGIGLIWNTGGGKISRICAEANMLGYYQQAGHSWPLDQGYGLYLSTFADIKDLRIKAAYWHCHNFISILGNPFYGVVSMIEKEILFKNPSMWRLGLEYSRNLTKAVAVGIEADLYLHTPVSIEKNGVPVSAKRSHTSFSSGVYLRLSPSFVIYKNKN